MSTTTQQPASPPEGQQLPRVTGEQVIAAYHACWHWPRGAFWFNHKGNQCEAWAALYMAAHPESYQRRVYVERGGNIPRLAIVWGKQTYDQFYFAGFADGWSNPELADDRLLWDEGNRFGDRYAVGLRDGCDAARAVGKKFECCWWGRVRN